MEESLGKWGAGLEDPSLISTLPRLHSAMGATSVPPLHPRPSRHGCRWHHLGPSCLQENLQGMGNKPAPVVSLAPRPLLLGLMGAFWESQSTQPAMSCCLLSLWLVPASFSIARKPLVAQSCFQADRWGSWQETPLLKGLHTQGPLGRLGGGVQEVIGYKCQACPEPRKGRQTVLRPSSLSLSPPGD